MFTQNNELLKFCVHDLDEITYKKPNYLQEKVFIGSSIKKRNGKDKQIFFKKKLSI